MSVFEECIAVARRDSSPSEAALILILRLCLTLLLTLAFLGCSSSKPERSSKVRIRYWTGWPGEEFNTQKKLIKEFEAAHPNIAVEPLCVFNDYLKVRIAFASGDPPNVCSAVWPEEFPSYAMRGLLTPLEDYYKNSGRRDDEFFPGIWKSLHYSGHLFGLVATLNTTMMALNAEVYRELGLDPEKPPETLEEFDRINELCIKYDDKGNIVRYGYRPAELPFWAYVFGGGWYDEKTQKITANRTENVAALEWMVSFARRHNIEKLMSFESALGSNFTTPTGSFYVGKSVFWFTGDWARTLINLYAPKLKYKVFAPPYPKGGRKNCSYVSASVWVIPKASKHKEEAWEFLNWMCSPSASKKFTSQHGNFTPLRAVANEPEYANDEVYRLARRLVEGENSFGVPQLPIWTYYAEEIRRAENYAVYGAKTPTQALDELQSKMEKELKKALHYAVY
jgi:multiple sugar transport system substrate-binding protein